MANLFLSSAQQSELSNALTFTVAKYGQPEHHGNIYCSRECLDWDCCLSCHCANSRN